MNIKKAWWVMGASYSAEYQSVLAYANTQGYELPQSYDKTQEDAMVRLLVSSGIWTISDQIFNLSATGDKNFALINLKAPGTRNATLSATEPIWQKGVGFYSNGTSSYVRTNYTPSAHGVNYTQNNAGVFIVVANNISNASHVEWGGLSAAGTNFASVRASGDLFAYRINDNTNVSVANASSTGRYGVSRTASNARKVFKNGVQVGTTSTTASTGLPTVEFYIGAYNNNGTPAGYSTKQIGFWLVGANLDSVIALLDTYIDSFLTTSQTITTSAFANKTNVSDFLSSASQLSSSLSYGQPSQELITIATSDCFGGALASNGMIYCPPGAATNGIKIDTSTKTISSIGTFSAGTFKYGGAVFANGAVYFIPASSTVVAKVNIGTDAVTFFDSSGVQGSDSGNLGATTQKWYGGYIGSDGKIYCLPYNATAVMIIDPTTDAITFLDTSGIVAGPTGNISGVGKWDTGAVHGQYIYGAPSDATDFLKINTSVPSCSRVSSINAGTAKYALAGLGSNGFIYFFPYFDNRIIKYDTSNDTYIYLSPTIGSIDTNEKVLGARILPTGEFLLVIRTSTISNHYIFNPVTEVLTPFPRMSTVISNSAVLASDGSVYAIPNAGVTTLQRFYYPRRTITLPDNFTDSNFLKGY